LIIIEFNKKGMQKKEFFTISLLLLIIISCPAQDYIITWNNDTIPCELPANPQKAGFRPRAEHNNGYFKLAAIFPNDSVRVINPGEIKGYYRAKHGRRLLCDGNFHSVKMVEPHKLQTDADGGKEEPVWYFMIAEEIGEYASMYKVMVVSKRLNTWYYMVKHQHDREPEGVYMSTRRKITEHLAEKDIEEDMAEFIKKNKSYSKMILEYNRLKKAAAK
jgi:hypothetical protein